MAKACFALRDADILPFGSPMFASTANCTVQIRVAQSGRVFL